MPDPTAWSDLQARFRKLAAEFGDTLTATWASSPWPTGNHWFLMRPGQSKIPDPDREKDLFISLAERAAVNLGQPVGKALYAWLDHLRENSSNFREADGPHEIHWDGVCVEKYTWGVMERPCQASADCCFK